MATRKRRKIGSAKKSGSKRDQKLVAKKRRSKKRTRGVSLTATAALGVGMKAEAGSFVSPSPGVTGVEAKAEAGSFVSPSPGVTGVEAKAEAGDLAPKPPPSVPNFGWWSRDDASMQAILQDAARRRAFVSQIPFSSMPPLPLRATIPEQANSNPPHPRNISLDGLGQSVTLDTSVTRARRDAAEVHNEILRRIAALEEVIATVPANTPGIGHNQPPGPIEQTPLTTSEVNEVIRLINTVKALPATPAQPPAEAIEAAGKLKIFAEKVLGYAAKQADNFVTEAVKMAGKAAGAASIWALLGHDLLELSNTIIEWLKALLH